MSFGLKLFDILTANATAAKSYINRMLAKKQDKLTFDSAPTTGSSNPVTSDGIRKAIDTATPNVDFSNYPTKNGTGATGTWPISISGAATKASQDSNGKVITDTYLKKAGDTATGDITAPNFVGHLKGNADTAANADKLGTLPETSFLRCRGYADADGEDTLWSQIGIKEYDAKRPKGISNTYNYGAVVSLPAENTRLDIWYNHMCSVNKDSLWYRSGWFGSENPWAQLLDSNNYNKFTPTKAEFNTVSKQAQTQADWNSTDSSSVSFIKNIPNSIKSINNSTHFRIKKFHKTDNHGWPTYKIVQELTYYHPTNRPSGWKTYGFSIIELCDIREGNGRCLEPAFMYASLGYEYDMLRSTSSDDFPVVLHNTESDKYYLAIRTMYSYKDVTLMGTFVHPDIELGEEILAQDVKGTPPSGWELTYKPKNTLNMDGLQAGRANDALKLTTARAINLAGDASGSATFDGSKDITVNTTVNKSKHAVNADTAAHANDVTDAVIKYDVSRTDGKFTAAASGVIGHLKNLTGSTDLTSMNKLRSYIGSVFNETDWFDVLSIRHRNGAADGQNFGLLMYSNLTNTDSIKYKKQPNSNGWTEERTLLDSSNYNNYAPTKTGSGASGTWDISITGNAVTANQAANDGAGNVITDTYTQKKEIKVSTDLDTLKETGFYNFPLSSICTDANHFPWGVASAVLVIKNGANGDGCTQICFPYNQEKFYKRTYMASTQKWHDWDTSAFMADLDSKQDKLVFDTTPTEGSSNPVTSDGIKKALASISTSGSSDVDLSNYVTKTGTGATGIWSIGINGNAATATKATQDGNGAVIATTYAKKADLTGYQTKLTFDTTPTASSANAITSGAVKAYVDAAIAAIVDGDSKTY